MGMSLHQHLKSYPLSWVGAALIASIIALVITVKEYNLYTHASFASNGTCSVLATVNYNSFSLNFCIGVCQMMVYYLAILNIKNDKKIVQQ